MNKLEIASKIVAIPAVQRNNGQVFRTIAFESGYFQASADILVADIQKALELSPGFLTDWLRWSEDKRTNDGWYFQETAFGKYSVSFFSENATSLFMTFDNKFHACATFIKNELEEMRC